jgi:hypothetical protein
MKSILKHFIVTLIFIYSQNYSKANINIKQSDSVKNKGQTSVIIGNTTYDLQTNHAMPRRIVTYPNRNISVIWIGSTDIGNNWPDRGTFYNNYNGISWGAIPTTRIESKRVGWGNIVNVPTGEVVVSHINAVTSNTGAGSVFGTTRNALEFMGLLYPRTVSVGNTIHAIIAKLELDTVSGFVSPVCYTRSTNGGNTFSTPSSTFASMAGYDTSQHSGKISGELYSIDASGNTVAILLLGLTEDVILLKSIDAGLTWTKKTIRKFPVKKYLEGMVLGDTIGATGQGSVVIDSSGIVHVVFSDIKISNPTGNELIIDRLIKSNYFNYWNDLDTTLRKVYVLQDLNGNGKIDYGINYFNNNSITYGYGGLSMQPALSISKTNSNRIILSFVAVKDADTTLSGVGYRSIYTMNTLNRGLSWSSIYDVSKTIRLENAYVSTPREILDDGYLHLTWLQDSYPGNSFSGAHGLTVSNIVYDKVLIEVKPSPNELKVGFNINQSIQCFNTNMFVFNDTSNIKLGNQVPKDSIISRLWSFGDNTFSNLENPIKKYFKEGIFDVKLIIRTANNLIDSVKYQVTVLNESIASHPINENKKSGEVAIFSISSDDTSAIYQWQIDLGWDFQNLTNAGQYLGVNKDSLIVSNLITFNNNQKYRCIINSYNCIDTSDIATLYVDNITLVNENIYSNIRIYPNPTNNIINIEGLSKNDNNNIQIFDVQGKIVITKTVIEKGMIDLSGLSKGVYVIKIGEFVQRIVKM